MDLTELDSLVREWRGYITKHPHPDDLGRDAGYLSGLRICAQQLDETLTRVRADMEA